MRAAIVDDEPLARSRLKRFLVDSGVTVVAEGQDGLQAIKIAENEEIDILFLDINMPRMNGIDASREIDQLITNPPAIVFCTAYDQYAIDAFKTNAVSYLLKPFSHEDISEVIEKAQKLTRLQIRGLANQKTSESDLIVTTSTERFKLQLNDVAYFYSKEKCTFARQFDGRDILIDSSLKILEQDLEESYIRVHRAYLVSRSAISRIFKTTNGSWELSLDRTDENLKISRRHLSEVRACFAS